MIVLAKPPRWYRRECRNKTDAGSAILWAVDRGIITSGECREIIGWMKDHGEVILIEGANSVVISAAN